MFRRLRYGWELRAARRRRGTALPADRAWVHPAELPGRFEHAQLPPPHPVLARRFQVVVAAAASSMLAAGGVLLAVSASAPAGATQGPKVAPTIASLPPSDRTTAAALLPLALNLREYQRERSSPATALVLPPGNLAVTTAYIPPGASVDGLLDGSRWVALAVVGRDAGVGVTVLRLPVMLPVTPVAPIEPAVTTVGGPTSLTALATVFGATTAVAYEYGPASLESTAAPAIIGDSEIAVTQGRSVTGTIPGAVVLNARGEAVATSVPRFGPNDFVPAAFLQLLAERLVLGDPSGHGWLQLRGADTPSGIAFVDAVQAHGASWGKVRPGDELLGVNSVAVHSMTDVDTMLYTISPGALVSLTLLRHGQVLQVGVRLAASP